MSASTQCAVMTGADLWSQIERALLDHHHEPDLRAARAVYSAVAAHRLNGQPVWIMAVAPPGSMKTDLLAALDGLPNVHLIDRITPNSFLSGQIKDAKRPSTVSPSLLHRIGQEGIIAHPDFSNVLSMPRTHRGSVLADMRRIYDGHLRKEYGTDDSQSQHEWRGRITFVVATTDEVDRHYSVFQTLGERFVMVRWSRPGGTEAALKAMNQNCERGKSELRHSVHAVFENLPSIEPILPPETQERVAALAEFAVRGRTPHSAMRLQQRNHLSTGAGGDYAPSSAVGATSERLSSHRMARSCERERLQTNAARSV